jgi:hypothetical protein
VANYCWFTDPSKALCLRLAGTPDADKPLIGMCESARCPQATYNPCHRPVWAQAVESTTVFLGNLSRGQKTEKARLVPDRPWWGGPFRAENGGGCPLTPFAP